MKRGSGILFLGVVLSVLLFNVSFVLGAEKSYSAPGIEIGYFLTSDYTVEGYDNCIGVLQRVSLEGKSPDPLATCYSDGINKISAVATGLDSAAAQCGYICLDSSQSITQDIEIGKISRLYDPSSVNSKICSPAKHCPRTRAGNGSYSEFIGTERECIAFVTELDKYGRYFDGLCRYNPTSGMVTASCTDYGSSAGGCAGLHCGYICINPGLAAPSLEIDETKKDDIGSGLKNLDIGSGRECIGILGGIQRGGRYYNDDRSACSYNIIDGIFKLGYRWTDDSWYTCNSLCTTGGFEYIPQCSDGIDNDGDGLIDFGYEIEGTTLAHYSFENNIDDLSGNEDDGVNYGASFVEGKTGKGVSFDGVDDYVTISDSTNLNDLQELTVTLWVNPKSNGHINGKDIITKYYQDSPPYASWAIDYTEENKFRFIIDDNDFKFGLSSVHNPGQWYFLTLVITNSEMKGYVNGIEEVSFSRTTNMRYNDEELYLGIYGGNQWEANFDGIIDEVKIWERALSKSEIEKGANDPQCTSDTDDSEAPECSNGVDDNNDGKIDALVEGVNKNNCEEIKYSNGETNCDRYGGSYYFGRTKKQASSEVDNFVDSFEEYTNTHPAGDTWCNQITANKVCELAGYKTAQTINLLAEGEFTNNDCSNSKCSSDRSCRGWHSPDNNYFTYWDESKNDFVNENAEKGATVKNLNRGIEKLLCTNPISACNDGIDNDGDTLVDYPNDPGCNSAEDNSEVPHDPQCDNPDDDTEGEDPIEGPTQCNDGYDNDKDGEIDSDDSDCWTDPTDPNTYDPNDPLEGTTQCNDGYDNDGDTLVDYPNDPDCDGPNDPTEGVDQCKDSIDNDIDDTCDLPTSTCDTGVNPGDSDCDGPDDPLEGTTQCNDEYDNDGDGKIDSDDSDCWTDPNDSNTYDPNDPIEGVYVPGIIELTDAHWRNMNDVPITEADLNDSVKLVVGGKEFVGRDIEFNITEKDGGWFWFDKLIDSTTSNEGFITWRAGQNGELTPGKYYFTATIGGETKSTLDNDEPYKYLVVSDTESNADPNAVIVHPENTNIFLVNTEVSFIQDSSDEDDEFTYIWNFGDNSVSDSTAGNVDTTKHTYTETGQKDVVLVVTDDRGLESTDSVSILIINPSVDEKHIFAYIDSPEAGTIIEQGLVNFDASSTFAIQTVPAIEETTSGVINCLAGKCPLKTSCGDGSDSCTGIDIIGAPLEVYSDIEFKWDFYQDTGNEFVLIASKIVDSATTEYLFPKADFYRATLTTSINPSSSANTDFYLEFEIPVPMCKLIESKNDVTAAKPREVVIGQSYWEINGELKRADDDSEINCYQADGVGSDGVDDGDLDNTCCPGNSICNPESGVCEFNTQPELGCAGIPERTCNGNTNVAIDDLSKKNPEMRDICFKIEELQQLNGNMCTRYTECYCEWVENEEDSGVCTSNSEEKTTPACGKDTPRGKCTITHVSSYGSCEDEGYIVANWIGAWKVDGVEKQNTDRCPAEGSTTFDCKDVAKLGFFSMFNFIIAILSIITIYGIILRKED